MNGLFARAREERGQAVVLITLALTVLLGMAALAIDVGYGYYVQRSLQSSADAAALAGASELPNASVAQTTAKTYAGSAGGKNERANVRGVQTTVTTKCVAIAPCFPVNAVQVTETTTVSTKFARVLGIDSFDVKVKATACSPCAARPLDVMLVLDRTLSMCMDHWGNYNSACTDLTNARNGLRTFVNYMDPALDRVGLAIFPPARNGTCATPPLPTTSNTPPPRHYVDASYSSSSYPYVVAPLETNYRSGTGLNPSSTLVSAINCAKGGGVTAYALALEKAQAELDARGRPDVQDIIVFFSDGAANYGPTYSPYGASSPYRATPCHQGVNSAAAIKGNGTLVFSIGYDLDAEDGTSTFNVCKNANGNLESPSITARSALQQIASTGSGQYFYEQPTPGELNTIYTKIAAEITGARLIADE